MTRKLIAVSTLALCVMSLHTMSIFAASLPHPRELPVSPLEFKPPVSERVVLSNGMVVHLLEDHELPLFSLTATVKVGSWLDPDDKVGLAGISGAVMRTGGTGSMTGDEMNEKLEFIAGSVEVGIGLRSGSAGLSVMSKDTDVGLEIFADVLMNPAFDEKKVDLRKNQVMESIRRRNDEPGPIARRHFKNRIYDGHPYGRIATLESVDSITREDLIAFHDRHFFPKNVILGVAGDFERDVILAKIEKAFDGWEQREVVADPPAVPFKLESGIYHLEKDVPQANIRLGHLGILKKNPDVFAITVMNFILGGSGFTSRLMREIRSNMGLAYSVGSFFSAGQELGVFGMSCQTKSATTAKSIQAMKNIAAQMTREAVTPEELKTAKDSILNSFVFQFESSRQIVGQAVSIEYQGLPTNWLELYKEEVSRVTAEDILRVAKKHLHLDKLIMIVVGKAADFDKPLSSFGAVNELQPEDFSAFDAAKAEATK